MASKRNFANISKAPDFIPLSDSSTPSAGNRNSKKLRKNMESSKKFSPAIYGDRHLVQRMRELIFVKEAVYPDEDSVTDKLREVHPEYKRRKRDALKAAVIKALEVIDAELPDHELPTERHLAGSKSDEEPEVRTPNLLNKSINNLYDKRSSESSSSRKTKSAAKEEQSASKAIDKALQKRVEMKQKYLICPKVTFDDFGGIDHVLKQINKEILHIKHSGLYKNIGIPPPRGFLIHGPPGVGKTMLVEALASELKVSFLKCASTELVTGISGESESKIRDLFAVAQSLEPCILFVDEIDAITQRREQSSREMEKRIVTQLLTSMDDLPEAAQVIVVGATSRPDSLDPALRRFGRFDKEINIGIPDEAARTAILQVLCKKISIAPELNFEQISHCTPGYVGADLKSLVREAALCCLERNVAPFESDAQISEQQIAELKKVMQVTDDDFKVALKLVQPSAKREGFATVPDISWQDIGALTRVREELQLSVLAPIKYTADVKALGLPTSVGVLLCGPPGCGKTLLAKAIANESGVNFISIKGPELLNMYVGESERAVRAAFLRARNSEPCVLFFDEIDALCRRRSDDNSGVANSVVNQLLTEMDGLESRDCILLAATNRPDILDPAILRPGRFDKIVYVGFPDASERHEILLTLTKNGTRPPLHPSVNLQKIALDSRTDGFTGAGLQSLIREASTEALKGRVSGQVPPSEALVVSANHLEAALSRVVASISKQEHVRYEKMKERYSSRR